MLGMLSTHHPIANMTWTLSPRTHAESFQFLVIVIETKLYTPHARKHLTPSSLPMQLSLTSAMCIFKYTKMFLAQGQFSRRLLVDKKLRVEFVLLISGVWEAAKEDARDGDYLQEEGMKIISDMLLVRCSIYHRNATTGLCAA